MADESELKTVADVIDAFGGLRAMSAIFGGGPSRFCNFKAKGRFPENMHMRIYVAACGRGLFISPELVGISAEDLRRLGAQKFYEAFKAGLLPGWPQGHPSLQGDSPELNSVCSFEAKRELVLQAAE
jgi:hypothetical protein